MINIKNIFLIIASFFFLTSCHRLPDSVRAPLKMRYMKDVVIECESFKVFSDMASCIKETYTRQGNTPNDISVKAFYSMIDSINEKYQMKNITETEARSLTYKALLETVESSNAAQESRSKSITCNKIGDTVICN